MVSHLILRKLHAAYSRAENLGGLASLPGGIYAYRGIGLSCQARPPFFLGGEHILNIVNNKLCSSLPYNFDYHISNAEINAFCFSLPKE